MNDGAAEAVRESGLLEGQTSAVVLASGGADSAVALAGTAATLGPVCAFVGGQVALEVLHQLTGLVRPATLGRAHTYDLRTMTVTVEDVPRLPGCPVCGGPG